MASPRKNGLGALVRSVLCPVDFSEHSRLAMRYAEAIALRANAALTVMYANDPLLLAAAAAALHDRRAAERSLRELRAFAGSTLGPRSDTQIRLKIQVATGDPADEVLKAATHAKADLIVVGTHGLTNANRVLLGSTTLSVLQRTVVPVLAVPRSGDAPTAKVSSSWPGERIVAALDLDRRSHRELHVAVRLAQAFDSSLVLLHVVGAVAAPAWLTGDLSAHDRIRISEAERQLEDLAGTVRPLVAVEPRVVCGDPGDEIAAFAAAERAELIVTALRDRRGWFGARRGSVSYHVLSHAVTPVLAIAPHWRPR